MKKGYTIETLRAQTVTPGSVEMPQKARRLRAHNPVYINTTAIKTETLPSKVLDGFALLEATGMGFPEDGRRADLSGQGYREVVEEDMTFFTGLVYLDCSDNMFDIKALEILPRLRELRMVCNEIQHIDDINGFQKLQYLDVSYNKLTLEAIQNLDALPILRDLDISGNDISRLPPAMERFLSLERLIAEHNKISDNSIFFDLCKMPKLRELSLAYNMLSCVPADACAEGAFRYILLVIAIDMFHTLTSYNRLLDLIDLAFNYIGTQAALEPFIELPRLQVLIVYGNPVLGSSGEDPTGVYVEELIDAAYEARDGYTLKVLDIVTEVPRKRTIRKNQPMNNRHATYKEFSIVQVDTEMDSLRKTTREFKQSARKTLFSQAVDIARTNKLPSAGAAMSMEEFEFDSTTFLTGGGPIGRGNARENEVADAVMTEIAEDMNLMDLTDIRTLREKMKNGGLEQHEDTVVPVDLFSRSMTQPNSLTSYPLAMNTAIKSLRFAINHPLTNHDELPSSSMFPAQHHVHPTQASLSRQLPRRIADGNTLEVIKQKTAKATGKNDDAKSLEPKAPNSPDRKRSDFKSSMRQRRKSALKSEKAQQARANTLQQIEDVLDGLNRNAREISSRGGVASGPDNVIVKGVTRPNTGIKGLVDMVNTVMEELES